MAVSQWTLAFVFTLILAHSVVHSMRQRKAAGRAGTATVEKSNQIERVRRFGPIVGAGSRVAGRALGQAAGRRLGQAGARNYGSLPLGYYRPPGPAYRPRRPTNVYHTETIIVGEAAPKPNALIPAPPNALVPWTAPRTALQTFRSRAVPQGLRFQHMRRPLGVGAGVLAAGAGGLWIHNFMQRDYSLIQVDTGGESPGWVATTNDPESNELTGRLLTPPEVEELGLESTADEDVGGPTNPCAFWQPWTWWNCVIHTSEEEVEKQGELPATVLPGICSDSRSGCDAKSCGSSSLRRFCAQTCGIAPCPPVNLSVEVADEDKQAEPEQCVDDFETCSLVQCNLLVGRIMCKKTCGVSPCPPNFLTLFPNVFIHNLNLTSPQLITDEKPVTPIETIEEINDDSNPIDDLKDNEMLLQWEDRDEMVEQMIENGFTDDKWQPVQLYTVDGKELVPDAFEKEALWPVKIVFEAVEHTGPDKDDEFYAEDADVLTDLVIGEASDSEEVFKLFDQAAEKPENLWTPEEIHDELCNSLSIGANGCKATDGKCRCFFGGFKKMECKKIFPSTSASLTVLKNRKLALFPFDGCKSNEEKVEFNGEMYHNVDLAVYAYNRLDPSLRKRRL